MLNCDIAAIRVELIEEKSGPFGRKVVRDERLCLETGAGSVYLRKTTLEAVGDSWDRVKNYFVELAREREIPYTDVEG